MAHHQRIKTANSNFVTPPSFTLTLMSGRRASRRPTQRISDQRASDYGEFPMRTKSSGGCESWPQTDRGTQSGSGSVRSIQSAGGVPAFTEATTPPTMAHVVSTSPPTWAVVQNARS